MRVGVSKTAPASSAPRRALTALAGAVACGWAAGCAPDADTVLDVRTSVSSELRQHLEETFEAARPGVDVRFSDDAPSETLARLRSGPGDDAPDVWLGAPAVVLETAAAEDRLEPYRPSWAEGPPRAWWALMTSPFVIAFDRTVVSLTDAPVDWIDVFHHGWFGEVGALDPATSPEGRWLLGAMLVEALRDDDDLDRGFDWLARLDEQVAVYSPSPEPLLRRAAAGDLLLTLVPRAAVEVAREGTPTLHYRLPASGTPEVARGVAVVAGTDVSEAARAFVDHLGSDEMATAIKRHTHWEPVAGEVDARRLPEGFELEQYWTGYAPAVDTLAAELDGWMERWELEVRTR